MLLYWILFPLLFGALLTGHGLLLRRVAGAFPAAYLLPAGYAVAVVATALLTWAPGTTVVAGPALIVLALAGWAVGGRGIDYAGLLGRHWRWIAGGIAGFLLFGASVILSGHPTFTGYTQIVDTGHQFDFASYLADEGRKPAPPGISAALDVVSRTLDVGYPSGSQALLGTIARTSGLEIAWMYQPMMAVLAGSLVVVLYRLLRLVVDSRNFALVGALTASQAGALMSYAQKGGIKELTGALMLLTATGFLVHLVGGRHTEPDGAGDAAAESPAPDAEASPAADAPRETALGALRAVLPIVFTIAAGFAIFSLTILPWAGLLAVAGVLAAWRTISLRAAALRAVIAAGLLVLLNLPTLVAIGSTSAFFDKTAGNEADLGNLAEPVSKWASTGVWLTGDHRFPLTGTPYDLSVAIGVVVILLAIVGLGVAVRRRAWPLVGLAVAAVVALTLLLNVMGPWVDFKAMVLTGPVALLFAAIGLSALLASKALRPVAWIGVAGLLAAGLYTGAERYRSAELVPYERMSELRDYGEKYTAIKTALLPDGEELGEYFLRKENADSPVNSHWEPTEASKKARPDFHFDWDLDELMPSFVQRHEMLVLRRSPAQSRPPANYRQIDQGEFYTVWQRTGPPAPVEDRATLSSVASPADRQACTTYLRAKRSSSSITIAPGPLVITTALDPRKISPNLVLSADGTAVTVTGPGQAEGQFDVGTRAGRYDVYVTGISHRKLELSIDGKRLPDLPVRIGYTGRAAYAGTIDVAAGTHPVKFVRGGGSLAPGTNEAPGSSAIGPIQLIPAGQLYPQPITTSGAEAKCPARVDWIEATP